jgi:hypothetical protein
MKSIHSLAGLVVALAAAPCLAEMPDFSGARGGSMPLMQQGRLFGGQGWWARYGEPVNATALSQADVSPSDKQAPGGGAIYPDGGGYGPGYAFGPGACDCPPPCIWGLWAGYWQNPKRCHPCNWLHRHGGCDPCGGACGARNCGGGLFGHHCGLFGHGGLFGGGCGSSCSAAIGCGCAAPVSCGAPLSCGAPASCSAVACDSGCKPVCGKCRTCHLGGRWHSFMAHWSSPCCDSCSAPIGCGCATPVEPVMPSMKQAFQEPPTPMPEEAKLFPLPRLR